LPCPGRAFYARVGDCRPGIHELRVNPWTQKVPQKTGTEQSRSGLLGGVGAFSSKKTNLQALLDQNLAVGIERALHAHALSFKLGYVALMIDVVHLS
jgi:hypothetical protein